MSDYRSPGESGNTGGKPPHKKTPIPLTSNQKGCTKEGRRLGKVSNGAKCPEAQDAGLKVGRIRTANTKQGEMGG